MKAFNIVLALLHRSPLRNISSLQLAVHHDLSKRPTTYGPFLVRNMAGHSKWQNIKHQKGLNDAIKANTCNYYAFRIRRAVLAEGPDPNLNSNLASVIAGARKANIPNTTIESAIKKASNLKLKMGEIEVIGPGGCLMLLEIESDNLNRTVHDVKSLLKKTKLGLLTKERCRIHFETKGIVRVSGKKDGSQLDIERAMDDAILADAEDVQKSVDLDGNEILVFISGKQDFGNMRKWLEESDYVVQDSGLEYLPKNPVELPEEDMELASQLCSQLEEMNDILRVNVNLR